MEGMGGLKDALSRYNQNEDSGEQPEAQSGEKGAGASGKVHAVHHHDHGDKHSVHHIMKDGTAQSETHAAGQGGDCPLCGGSGKA